MPRDRDASRRSGPSSSARSWRWPARHRPSRGGRSASGPGVRSLRRSCGAVSWGGSPAATRPDCLKGGSPAPPRPLLAEPAGRRGVRRQSGRRVRAVPGGPPAGRAGGAHHEHRRTDRGASAGTQAPRPAPRPRQGRAARVRVRAPRHLLLHPQPGCGDGANRRPLVRPDPHRGRLPGAYPGGGRERPGGGPLALRRGQPRHPPLRVARALRRGGLRGGRRPGSKGPAGHPRRPPDAHRLLARPAARHRLPLHAQAQLLAQPDRALAEQPGPHAPPARLLHLGRPPASAGPRVHRLRQPHHGQALQMDLSGQGARRLHCGPISAQLY